MGKVCAVAGSEQHVAVARRLAAAYARALRAAATRHAAARAKRSRFSRYPLPNIEIDVLRAVAMRALPID